MTSKELDMQNTKEIKGRSLLQDAIRRILRNKLAVIAMIVIFIYILFALVSILNLFNIKEAAMSYHLDYRYVKPFVDSKNFLELTM